MARNMGTGRRVDPVMRLEMTDDARELLGRRGGTVAVDLIRPTGWGKVAEVAVATSIKGRRLDPYLVLRDDDLQVLVTPELAQLARTIHVEVRRGVRKGLAVRFSNALG